jgi:uncharacterized protein (TIGR02266 family)
MAVKMRTMAVSDRERRTHFRGKSRPGRKVDVEYVIDGAAPLRAYTRNIGVGGAFIVTKEPCPPGTLMAVTLLVPGGPGKISVRAEVRWSVPEGDPPGMGVKFLALEVDELLELNEYFASLTGTED